MNKKRAIWITIPFCFSILAVSVLNIVNQKQDISKYENRALSKLPTLKDIKDGSFGSKYDSYYSDQFINRDEIMLEETKRKLEIGKTSVSDLYLVDNNWILTVIDAKYDEKSLKDLSVKLNDFKDKVESQGKEFMFTFTPYKTNILKHLYPEYETRTEVINEKENAFIDLMDENSIPSINIDKYFFDTFNEKELESLYFKTDHHWNMDGGYEAFKFMVSELNSKSEVMGNIDVDYNKYKRVVIKDKTFEGSYNQRLYFLINENEEVPRVENITNPQYKSYLYDKDKGFYEIPQDEMFYMGRNSDCVSYESAYVRGEAYYKIVNENSLTDKKILVYRDSYQSVLVPFLADIFREVIAVDPRNIQEDTGLNAVDIALKSDVDIVMPIFNSQDFQSMTGQMLK